MSFPSLSHHGGTRSLTGSCHQLHLNQTTSILIDCGLEQGDGVWPGSQLGPIEFKTDSVRALIITHVHLDHVGRIPALLAAGYRGPIFCSEPSARLLPLVLEDAYKLAVSADSVEVDRYLALVRRLIVALPFGCWYSLENHLGAGCSIRLQRAGHVLGSSYVECDVHPRGGEPAVRVVFSGDLGGAGNPLLQALKPPERADILVLESTYGNRVHTGLDSRLLRLEAVIDRALSDGGTVLIPAFSLGRTQELLYEIEDILHRKRLSGASIEGNQHDPLQAIAWADLPVILDSPLARRITQAYQDLNEYWNAEARQRLSEGRSPLAFSQLICVDSHDDHQKVVNYLRSTRRPAIVIAGNGMCSGGRIVNYLKAMLGDSRHEVLFVGYQAKGTPGRVIQASEGAQGFVQIDLDGELHEIRAKAITLEGYSAHADQEALLNFAAGELAVTKEIILVHGEPGPKKVLAKKLELRYAAKRKTVAVRIPA
ncbi:MBL fold metallo-hydrolase RNA specificity domain-containing protein [Pseudomonas oryzicola]|uniref:MBL fold metallo-hydrolase n=1 Tax=Pseudomonas oryzicola TaxID=485876 RepID=A0ABS6QGP2_9PSED|nr:MBL fold metallo-hydrolase [Pseudomonas oryzicola]MBV4493373.1 MBL fold metallo-hydrolase [Pseudomonas oryzicola]